MEITQLDKLVFGGLTPDEVSCPSFYVPHGVAQLKIYYM